MLSKVTAKLPVINSVTFSLRKTFTSDKGSNIAFFIRLQVVRYFHVFIQGNSQTEKKSVTSTCPALQQHQIVEITYS